MRTLFFGTPELAVPTLLAMLEAGFRPDWVISQPSRPVGRRQVLTDPPVVAAARREGLAILQPERVREQSFMETIATPRPDVAVVVAFGQIFRQPLLDLPRLGCINVHASLLPKYRGAAPIQGAIAHGDRITGVTTMRMERGLDSGPMLLQAELAIGEDETSGELAPRLAALGATTLVETLRRLAAGDLEATPQDHGQATLAPKLSKDDGVVDWRWSARKIYDHWRAFTPWPGISTALAGRRVKILAAKPAANGEQAAPGSLLGLRHDRLAVQCGGGTILEIERLQAAGKKALSAVQFVNGERLQGGERFTDRHEILSGAATS